MACSEDRSIAINVIEIRVPPCVNAAALLALLLARHILAAHAREYECTPIAC